MPENTDAKFNQGVEAGRVAQILREHSAHFDALNGSLEKSAHAMTALTGEIRGVREDMRLAAERVEVARDVLAKETERRREELAGTAHLQDQAAAGNENKLSRRERIGAAVMSAGLAVIGYLLSK